MATESLIVELDARTQKLDAALISTNKKLESLDKQTQKNDTSFNKLTKTAGAVGSALKVTTTAGLALATALTAVVLKTAASEQELAILSRQAKLSTTDFEALAFATKQYGIDAEGIADISKDIADKLGEFSKRATGPFQDFADQVGLSKEEAKALAVEMEDLSSDKVIGRMVSMMEEAGSSGNEMTSVLESMGNDLSRLIPLYTDNSKGMKELQSVYKSATGQMKLTANEIKGLNDAATSFDLLTDSLREAGGLISAQIAPLLNEFFSSFIKVVPVATQTIVDFINSFKDPKDIDNIASAQKRIVESEKDLVALIANKKKLTKDFNEKDLTGKQDSVFAAAAINKETEDYKESLKSINSKISKQVDLIGNLKAREAELLKQRKTGVDAPQITGALPKKPSTTGGTVDEIAAIEDRFKTEEGLLREKLAQELIIVGENNELKLQLEQEFQDNLALIRQEEFNNAVSMGDHAVALFKANEASKAKISKGFFNDREATEADYLSASQTITSALSSGSETAAKLGVVANTASAITRQFVDLPYPLAIATSAAIAVNGARQLSSIGSESLAGSSSSASVSTAPEPTAEVTVNDVDVSGQSESRVVVAATSDEIVQALNELMNEAKTSGVI